MYSGGHRVFSILPAETDLSVKILVTGAAGFIGYHLTRALIAEGHQVAGLDNLNDYYDPALKLARLNSLGINSETSTGKNFSSDNQNLRFYQLDLIDVDALHELFKDEQPDIVIHLAAQAGVRHSIKHPQSFIDSNVQGLFNVLEAIRNHPVKHFLYASSSSVYGSRSEIPFSEEARTNAPISLYGATKKAGEVIAHSYVELYKIPSTGLRFFTVYGPWGRPDMAYYKFADHIMRGDTIDVYNHGEMERDFTYVDDIVNGILPLMALAPEGITPHRILNIGRSKPVNLLRFIELLEGHLGKKANKNFLPMQQGEIATTWADVSALKKLTGYSPATDLDAGIRSFAEWYMSYHAIRATPTSI
jgi:UDP-glucuronate 4-epimerase